MWTFPLSDTSLVSTTRLQQLKVMELQIPHPQWSMGWEGESVQQIMASNSYGYQVGITDLAHSLGQAKAVVQEEIEKQAVDGLLEILCTG